MGHNISDWCDILMRNAKWKEKLPTLVPVEMDISFLIQVSDVIKIN